MSMPGLNKKHQVLRRIPLLRKKIVLNFFTRRLSQKCLKLIFLQRRNAATLDFQLLYTLHRSVFA